MVSEMLGETLKLAIVVTMVAVFGLSVYAQLPDERVPYIEIELKANATNSSYIDLSHVGGDPVNVRDITIEVVNSSNSSDMVFYRLDEICNRSYWTFPQTLTLNTKTSFSENLSSAKVSVIHTKKILAIAEVDAGA